MIKAYNYKSIFHFFLVTSFLAFISLSMTSCDSEDASSAKPRTVKYEITGNFTGRMIIVYTGANGANTVVSQAALPWSVELTFPSSTLSAGIGAQGATVGVANQNAIMKIFVNGTEVKSSSATAGSLGEIILPAIAHTFTN